jgi:hypothetical protein
MASARWTASEEGPDLRISIRLGRGREYTLFLLCVLAFCIAAYVALWLKVLVGYSAGREGMAWVGLIAIPMIAIPGFVLHWRQYAGGRDILTVSDGTLSLRREAFGIGFTSELELSGVQYLRFQPAIENPQSRIAFNYGPQVISFGAGLSEGEAENLIATIERHVGVLASDAHARPVSPCEIAAGRPAALNPLTLSEAAIPRELRQPPPRRIRIRPGRNDIYVFAFCAVLILAILSMFVWGLSEVSLSGTNVWDAVIIASIVFSIFAIVLFRIGASLFQQWRLTGSGATTVGRVTGKRWIEGENRGYARLRYAFALPGQPSGFEAEQLVKLSYYDRVEVGDEIVILYDPVRPERNFPYEDCPFEATQTSV